jgi:hypothetical protein
METRRESFKQLPWDSKVLLILGTPLAFVWIAIYNTVKLTNAVAHFWMD